MQGERLYRARKLYLAERMYEEAVKQARLMGKYNFHLGVSLDGLGKTFVAQKEYDRARPFYQEALQVLQNALKVSKNELDRRLLMEDTARVCADLADTYLAEKKYAEAAPLYLKCVSLSKGCNTGAGSTPRDNLVGQNEALSLYKLGVMAQRERKFSDAENYYKQALATANASSSPAAIVERMMDGCSEALRAQGREQEAEDVYITRKWLAYTAAALEEYEGNNLRAAEALHKKALSEAEKLGSQDLHVSISLQNLATIYAGLDELPQAEDAAVKALEIRQTGISAEKLLTLLGELYMQTGRYREAEPILLRLISARQRKWGQDNIRVGDAVAHLALAYQRDGKADLAKEQAARAFKIYQPQCSKKSQFTTAQRELATTLLLLRDLDHAAIMNEQLVAMLTGDSVWQGRLSAAYLQLACIYREQHKEAQAKYASARARQLFNNIKPGWKVLEPVRVEFDLGSFYDQAGRPSEARQCYEKAVSDLESAEIAGRRANLLAATCLRQYAEFLKREGQIGACRHIEQLAAAHDSYKPLPPGIRNHLAEPPVKTMPR